MTRPPKKDEKGPQREREEEVLRRLLSAPPKPHKPEDGKARKDAPDK